MESDTKFIEERYTRELELIKSKRNTERTILCLILLVVGIIWYVRKQKLTKEQYIHSQDRTNAEDVIYKKVVSLVDDFTNNYTNREKFEAMLDEDLDNIMSHLRAELPSLKEKDYLIFGFLVIGLDVTTVSNLLNMTANTVYIRKSRIRRQIEEHNPKHAAQFLEFLGLS